MDLRVCIIRYVLLLSNKFKDALGSFYYSFERDFLNQSNATFTSKTLFYFHFYEIFRLWPTHVY